MRLLIVEDEIKIANSLKKGFLEENFVVDAVNDGERGLFLASTEEYDVIILDLMLPKIDGISLLSELREKNIYTPIIILTAKDRIEDKVKGLNVGADDYLAKPFSFDELLARVRVQIRKASHSEITLKVNTLELNPFSHIVKRNEKEIPLSKKEFALLEYMMRHKGAILSENQIISHIWDYDSDNMSNVVAAHIKNLRQKIDKAFPTDKNLLFTVRGLGYRIYD